jgi:hypothetical protein
MPKRADMNFEFPLEVKTKDGKTVPIGSGKQLRALAEYILEWSKVFDAAESIAEVPASVIGNTAAPVDKKIVRLPKQPEPGKTTQDYLDRVLLEYDGMVNAETAVRRMEELGWTTDSPTAKRRALNVQSTARKHPSKYVVGDGCIEIIGWSSRKANLLDRLKPDAGTPG